jgi:hypothetical protein
VDTLHLCWSADTMGPDLGRALLSLPSLTVCEGEDNQGF